MKVEFSKPDNKVWDSEVFKGWLASNNCYPNTLSFNTCYNFYDIILTSDKEERLKELMLYQDKSLKYEIMPHSYSEHIKGNYEKTSAIRLWIYFDDNITLVNVPEQ